MNKIRFTRSQMVLSAWLHEYGINHLLEKEFAPYVLDVYISDTEIGRKIGIEIDSQYHVSKKRDLTRDKFLKEFYGIDVLRLDCQEMFIKNRDVILEKVREFIYAKSKEGTESSIPD